MGGFCYKVKAMEESGVCMYKIASPGFFFGKGKISKWFENYETLPNVPTYLTYGIFPHKDAPKNIYNLWEGFRVERKEFENIDIPDKKEDIEKLIKPILDHFMITSNHHKGIYNYQLNWFAHKIQKPGKKVGTCLVYLGIQGTGKTTICEDIMRETMGCNYIFSTNDIEKIAGKFNAHVRGKTLCILNELNGKDSMPLIDRIKEVITRKVITIEPKCVDPIDLPDFVDYCFTTNNINPIKETKEERRFQIIYTSDEKKGDAEYFKNLYDNCIDNKRVIKAFYYYLKNHIDISKFHPENDRVIDTEEILELQEMNRCRIEEFADYFFMSDTYRHQKRDGSIFIISKFTLKEIYSYFKQFQSDSGFNNFVNDKTFSHKFSKYKKWINCFKKYKSNGSVKYEIDWDEVDKLLEKQFAEEDDN